MKNQGAALALGLLLCFLVSFPKASELTLKKAQELMLFRNFDLVVANQEYCKKSFEESEAKAVWYPSLDVIGNYNYLSEKNSIVLPSNSPLAAMLGPNGIPLGTNYKTEAGFDLSWPLTTAFVNMYNVRYRHLAVSAKEAQNLGLKNQYSFRLGAMFLQWNMSFQQADVYKTLVTQLADLSQQTENLRAGGLASVSRVLDVKARLAGAKADLVTAQNQSDSLKLELLNFIQCQDSAFAPDDYSFPIDSVALASIDTVKLNAVRPELLALDLGIEQLSVLQSIITGQRYPNLVAVAGYRYANPGLAMGSDKFMSYGQAGLQLKWNLFDGGKVSSQHRETGQQIEIAEKQRQQMIDTWNNAIKNAKLSVVRAIRQSEAADASLAAAEALATDAKNNLAAGVATQADVLNALTARSRAALGVKQAVFMKNLAILQLYYAAGKELNF
jgi:outer membrane protein, adhesin transport system